jgi:hypothetical protein
MLSLFSNVRLLNLLTSYSDHSPMNPSAILKDVISKLKWKRWLLGGGHWIEIMEITDHIGCCADELKRWSRRKHMKFKEEVKECMEDSWRHKGDTLRYSFRRKHFGSNEPKYIGSKRAI